MNRNILKIIAVISMLLDHIGAFIFPSQIWFRIIGRIAFPIFAFFIAEGLKHTRSRKRYVLALLICGVVSQIPYSILFSSWKFNIIFTFLYAILLIYLLENIKKNSYLLTVCVTFLTLFLIVFDLFQIISYGIFGVILVIVFYFSKNKKQALFFGFITLIFLAIRFIDFSNITFTSFNQFFAIFSLVLLYFYNHKKGKLNLKYLFYVFYPLHLLVVYIISSYL